MLTPNVFALLPGRRPLRHYRRTLQQTLQADRAVRLLPALLDIPLGCAPLPDADALMAAPTSWALLGPPAGGRTLALFQIAAHWANGSSRVPLVCLPLSELDSPNLSPRAVVTAALHRAGTHAATIESRQPALLLVDDWEQLPANRRVLWRQYLAGLSTSWPTARAVVALPPSEAWPELSSLSIAPPDESNLAVWLGRLLPNHDPAPILAALTNTALAVLRNSLPDLLLFALVYPMVGLPTSRAALYEQAFALIQPVLSDQPHPSFEIEAPYVKELGAPLLLGRAALRHYRLARGLAGGADLATLADLPAHERAAVAPLAAGLLDDPTPVLDLLWNIDNAETPDYVALLACTRERPNLAPAHTLRLLEQLTTTATTPQLTTLTPVLPALLIATAQHDLARTLAIVPAIAQQISSSTPWLALVDTPAAPPDLRWAAVEQLVATPPPVAILSTVSAYANPVGLAGRAYLCLHTIPLAGELLMSRPLSAGLDALLDPAADSRRRHTVATRLLATTDTPPELRRMALAAAPTDAAEDVARIETALTDPNAELRQTARTRLLNRPPAEACAALERALTQPNLPTQVANELLGIAAHVDAPGVVKLLARCAATAHQQLPVRLYALDQLATLGAPGSAALLSLLPLEALPTPVRATIVRQLGARGQAAALPYLRTLVLNDGPPLVRRAAAAALADLVRRPATHDAAMAGLMAILRRPQLDREVSITALHGLTAGQPTLALPAIAARLDPRYAQALAQVWKLAVPQLAQTHAHAWLALPLPTSTHIILADALAVGATPADQPTSLDELAMSQALAEARAAVNALTTIACREPTLIIEIQARLRRTLTVLEMPGLTEAILSALAQLTPTGGQAELVRLLDDPASPLNLRWQAIDTLGGMPGGADSAMTRLQRNADDPFTCSKLVAVVGEQNPPGAVSILRQVAEAAAHPEHLRRAALSSLSNLDDPTALNALVRTVAEEANPNLRAHAATLLPTGLANATCRALRDVLRSEREPAVLAAILGALGRAGDRDALPILLRYTQSEHAAVALAAIESVAAIGDASLASPLVRVSQNSQAAPHVRLAAVCALIQLCGDEFVSLLRDYLNNAQLTLRLRAHAALAAQHPNDSRLITPVADPEAPLALRMEALTRLAARTPNESVIRMVLANPDETPQLRLLAAAALARADDPASVNSLTAILETSTIPLLQRRCIDTLAILAQSDNQLATTAQHALETIILSAIIPPAIRHWASAHLNTAPRRR